MFSLNGAAVLTLFFNLHQISPRHADEEDEQVAAAAMKELEMLMPNFCGTSSANR